MIGLPTLEPARPADAAPIARLSRELIEHGLAWAWRPGRIAAAIRDPEVEVVVARDGSGRIGFSLCQLDFARQRAHLALLAVVPSQRRQGIGGALVEWSLEIARRGGVRSMELEVRAGERGARSFYRALGWIESGRIPGYYQGREDAVRMTRSIGRR